MLSAFYRNRDRLLPPLPEAAVEHHCYLPDLFHMGLEVFVQRAAVPMHKHHMQHQITNSSSSHTRSVTPAAIAGVTRSEL